MVDFVLALEPDATLDAAWRSLPPAGSAARSWNHTIRARHQPIAVNIETKAPLKSWTDGKPQIAIWTDAWLERLRLLGQALRPTGSPQWAPLPLPPAVPLLIAQGHDWHLLTVVATEAKTVLRDKIDVGSSRSCWDVLRLVATLHWLMHWAETVWRPYIESVVRAIDD